MMTSQAIATQRKNATQPERNETYEDAALLSVPEPHYPLTEVLDATRAATVLGVTVEQAETMMNQSVLPVFYRENQRYFAYKDLLAYIRAGGDSDE